MEELTIADQRLGAKYYAQHEKQSILAHPARL